MGLWETMNTQSVSASEVRELWYLHQFPITFLEMLLGFSNSPALLAKAADILVFLSYGDKSQAQWCVSGLWNLAALHWGERSEGCLQGTDGSCRVTLKSMYIDYWGGRLSCRYSLYQYFYPLIKYSKIFGIINKKSFNERELFFKTRG